MAHLAVERRSVSMEKWTKIVFEQIEKFIFKQSFYIDGWEIRSGQYFPEGYLWEDEAFAPINEGDVWGGPDVTSVFNCNFAIPEGLQGEEVWFYMLTPTEVMVSENGKYLDGIDPNRIWFKYIDKAQAGEKHSLMLEAYTRSKPDDDRNVRTARLMGCLQHFKRPQLVVPDHDMLSLKYDLDMIYQTAYAPYIDSELKTYLQKRTEDLLKLFPLFDCEAKDMKEALPAIKKYINDHIFNGNHPFGKNGKLACVAHSHLDIAYHWKVCQTVQKNARTVLIQLRLMDRYPEFKYAHTQAWTYEMLEKYYPDLFQELKKKVEEGKWEIVGGMYVEPDCNLITAESLARQILYGKQYFQEKFNVDVDNCWLPDVFGNSAIMPQILKQGGINYFVSNKMSTWNDTNLFPHNNFIWRGLDGTDIFACVPPVHFITWMDPNQAVENWERFQDKAFCGESLQMYGYGDGGSGATDEMLEYFHRQEKLPGIPEMRLTTGKEYLESAFENAADFPVWDGDLYLEMHRGTFTTKADLKRYNRMGEFLAQETETIVAFAALLAKSGNHLHQKLKEPWKKLLLNQFHDILPGSHTAPVAVDAVNTYEEMIHEFNSIKGEALQYLAEEGGDRDFLVVNMFSDSRGRLAFLDSSDKECQSIMDQGGNSYPLQKQIKPDGKEVLCAALPKVPGLSITQFKVDNAVVADAACDMRVDENCMQNKFFQLNIDNDGKILHIFDKLRNKHVNETGAELNDWQMFDDRPGVYNAWDIVKTYEHHKIPLPEWKNIKIVEKGPISIALRMEREFGDSRAVQIIRMYNENPRIDFETWVDWQEDQKLLKVAFPINIKARVYTADTSAGVIERMNNKNTSWEQARFEVPCHKWVDMSEGMFGVSVLNDCKYGCDVSGNVIRLSLLRAPIRPDRESDRGKHYFTYSLFTHGGSWQRDGLVEEAYDMNRPLILQKGKLLSNATCQSVLQINNPSLKCQAFKLAEDNSGDIIVRLVELYGSHGKAVIKPAFLFNRASVCNVLEAEEKELPWKEEEVRVEFKPYQIISIRLVTF